MKSPYNFTNEEVPHMVVWLLLRTAQITDESVEKEVNALKNALTPTILDLIMMSGLLSVRDLQDYIEAWRKESTHDTFAK